MIIGGVYCLFTPDITYMTIGYLFGLAMVFDAVGRFVMWSKAKKDGLADGFMLTGAVLSAIFGFFILNSTALQVGVDAFIIYYIAIWLVCYGALVIARAWKIRRLHKNWNTKMVGTHWYMPLCVGILLCVFGILSMIKPIVLASTIGIFIGLGIISAGAELITLATTPEE